MTGKRIGQAAAGCLCAVLWSLAIGFDARLLLSLRDFVLVMLGAVLLTLPVIKETRDKKALWAAFKKQLTISGYLASFILIFAEMTSPKDVSHITMTVALCLRPALYGVVLYLLLGGDEKPTAVERSREAQKDRHEVFRQMGLTAREAEIAVMISRRMSNREIAEELYISETTVKKHVSHIFEKLEIDSRNEIEDVIEAQERK